MADGVNEVSAAMLGSADTRFMLIFSLIAAIGIWLAVATWRSSPIALESRITRLESQVSELEKGVSDE